MRAASALPIGRTSARNAGARTGAGPTHRHEDGEREKGNDQTPANAAQRQE